MRNIRFVDNNCPPKVIIFSRYSYTKVNILLDVLLNIGQQNQLIFNQHLHFLFKCLFFKLRMLSADFENLLRHKTITCFNRKISRFIPLYFTDMGTSY